MSSAPVDHISPKTALITGGAKRIGHALTTALARRGVNVAIHYHHGRAEAEALAAHLAEQYGIESCALNADLRKQGQAKLIDDATQALGPLDLLINNASLFEADTLEDLSEESWHDHLAVNLTAPIRLSQRFAAQAPKGASIIHLLDQRVLAPTPKFFSYSIAKSALFAATLTMAQSLGPKNIRVNAIGPGPTLRNHRQSEQDWQRQNDALLLGHGATPDDICQAMLYLVDAPAVTGQMIAVDGGQHLAWQTADVLVKE